MVGADLRAALVASCLRGALPPVDLRAVCLVRAILRGARGVVTGVGGNGFEVGGKIAFWAIFVDLLLQMLLIF